jgi:molecular chaperone DnaK (HSP70)
MTSNHDLANVTVFGFDLGHGETALAYIEGCEDKENQPKMVFNPPSDITAIAYLSTGEVVWGETAMSHQTDHQTEEFDIGFKCKPGSDPDLDKKISDFALTVYNNGKSERNLNEQEPIELFIGCPSGWSKEEREKYQQLFTQAGLLNVTIIPESEAAYAYYFEVLKKKQKEQQISLENLRKYPLILDFGSSTLDATLERVIGDPISDGMNLGASLIDQAILTWNLEHCLDVQYPLSKSISESYIKDLNNVLDSDRSAYAFALLECRKAKEAYWKKRTRLPLNQKADIRRHPFILGDIALYIFIDDELIQTILNTPLTKILPKESIPKDEKLGDLGRYSWL